MLTDQITKNEAEIRDLRNDAADRAEQVLTTQRKLYELRSAGGAADAAAAASGGPTLSPAPPSLGGPRRSMGGPGWEGLVGGGGGGGGPAAAEAAAEAAEATALLEKRTAELDAEREVSLRLQRCACGPLCCALEARKRGAGEEQWTEACA